MSARKSLALGSPNGQILPALMLLIVVLLAGGVLLFQAGRATVLQADAQTAADAAALAAATDVKAQYLQFLQTTAVGDEPFIPDLARARGAAEDYAQRNQGRVTTITFPSAFRVDVEVENAAAEQLRGVEGPADAEGVRGRARASAVVEITYTFPAPGGAAGGGGGGGAGGGSGPGPGTPGACRLSDGDLSRAAGDAGVGMVPPNSSLRAHGGCGNGPGVSVSGLALQMRAAILRIERALGRPVQITSGFRTAGYQAQLCRRVVGPCAPPGRSMHQYGLAIDVANYREVAAVVNSDRSIGLCQPLPANDAVHFSHVSGRECGGTSGALPRGQIFGGDVSNYAIIDVHLVE